MKILKYGLVAFLAFFLFVFNGLGAGSACAQQAVPVPAVKSEVIEAPVELTAINAKAPVIIELFSSQACIFCPQADKYFAELVNQPNVIGFSCHIDYFDVKEGALSAPFCTARQDWYAHILGSGPNYTPQVVLQGRIDSVGHKPQDLEKNLRRALAIDDIGLIDINPVSGGGYMMSTPAGLDNAENKLHLWLVLYDKPHTLTVPEGANKGKDMTYYNIASALNDMGVWQPEQQIINVQAAAGHKGFVILLQDIETGDIAAAGQYEF